VSVEMTGQWEHPVKMELSELRAIPELKVFQD
jgi:hypothetical protein